MANPERDAVVAWTKKEREAIMRAVERYILSVGNGGSPYSEMLGVRATTVEIYTVMTCPAAKPTSESWISRGRSLRHDRGVETIYC